MSKAMPASASALLIYFQHSRVQLENDQKTLLMKQPEWTGLEEVAEFFKEHWHWKAQVKKISTQKFIKFNKPTFFAYRDQEKGYGLLIPNQQQKIMVFQPSSQKTVSYTVEEFNEIFGDKFLKIQPMAHSMPSVYQNWDFTDFGVWWFMRGLFRFRALMHQVLAGALLVQIFALITPMFTMIIIDKVLTANGMSTLHVLIIGLMVMSLFDFLIGNSRQYLLHLITEKVDFLTANNFFHHLLALPLRFYTSRQSGDSISRIKELEVIRHFFTGSVLLVLIDFPFLIVFILCMFLFSVPLTFVVLCFTLLTFALYGFFGPFLKKRLKRKTEIQVDNQSFLIEVVNGMEVIKSAAIEPTMQERWIKLQLQQAANNKDTEVLNRWIGQSAGLCSKLTTAVSLWFGAVLVLNGHMTPGQLIAFNMMIGRVLSPVQRISQLLQQIHQLKISFSRVREILQTPTEQSLHSSMQLPELKGQIKFDQVSFRYHDDQPDTLSKISFDIKAGEIIGVVGSTGSGKTTLIRLIQRLYQPTAGNIFIDGINISGIDPVWFRKRIGVVVQDNHLFNASIKENILMTKPMATIEEIVGTCELIGADQWIRSLPKAYDTLIGEKGQVLSTGQRQMIAIIKALIHDPAILIFDEATSALDYESEQLLQASMQKITQGRTVILVAHRLPTLRLADRILTIEKGLLIENDSIQKLLKKKNSRFRQLFELQAESIKNY